ncbi:protein HESO1 isoform X2 [Capsella rubella]|uniref:protein HESO1 isoform X2 n=1 Tax=Capsella rubella TaxID=81985 RepID=UPI000CD54D09|nr:protein HESO1 isoform X2 [Capsella rubella]
MVSPKIMTEEKKVWSKGIRKKVKNTMSIALKKHKIDSYILLDLDKVLDDVYCSVRPVPADYDTRKELVKNLNTMANDIYEESSPVLEAYGSFLMDMYSSQSDLDLSIVFGNVTSELPHGKKLHILERFAKELRSLEGKGLVRNVVTVSTARVPIVKFFDQGTGIYCDLSVECKEGILNSQIIRIISQIDDRFQKLCLLVKHWAKAHRVNNASSQTLNSISITLLVAHHLQTQNPPILPPFSTLFKDGIDPPKVERRTQKFLNWGQCNQESLGKLFATFFIKLQSVEVLWKQGLCASVLQGLWISKKRRKAHISVEDFTDVSKNFARSVTTKGAVKIHSSINKTVDNILEFLNGKITGTELKHSLFEQQTVNVVEPSPTVLSPLINVCSKQQPHNNKRKEFVGLVDEENKRVCLENGHRAVRGNGGLVHHHRHDGRFSGEEPMPVGLWHEYSQRLDLPLPPPPYGSVLYDKFGLY